MINAYQKIPVAVDGSNHSFNASTLAINLAKRVDAELIVLHFIDPRVLGTIDCILPRPGRFKEIEKKVMEDVEKILEAVRIKATEKNVHLSFEQFYYLCTQVNQYEKDYPCCYRTYHRCLIWFKGYLH